MQGSPSLQTRLLTEAEQIERRLGVTGLPELLREAAKAVEIPQASLSRTEEACRQAIKLIDAGGGAAGIASTEELASIRKVLRDAVVSVEDQSARSIAAQAREMSSGVSGATSSTGRQGEGGAFPMANW